MARIEIIQPENATGELKAIYEQLCKDRGKVAEVHKIQSLNPKTITKHMDLYMEIMFGKSPLKRVDREMVAVVVSAENKCAYCIKHHAEAVLHYWKDKDRVHLLSKDFKLLALPPRQLALCEYAVALTKQPEKQTDGKWVEILKKEGLSDRAILDATLVISYFNFVNRIVLSLGVELENNPGGYKY